MSEVQSDSHASSDDDDDVAAEQQDQNKDHEEDEEEAEDAEDDEQQQQEIQQEDMDDALQDPHQPSDGPPSHVADHMQRVPIVKGPAHVLIEQGNAFYRQSELRAALNLYVRAAELVRRSQKEMHVLLAALLNAGETLLQLGDGEGPGFSFLQEAMTMVRVATCCVCKVCIGLD